MYSQEELNISNKSYINKDFPTLYNELLDIAQKISYKYDPTTSNESDPFIVLAKLIALAGDKLNYNVDKNILERFLPSITQWNSMQERTSSLGYNMHYYKSAEGYITMKYNQVLTVDDLIDMPETATIKFKAFKTKFSNSSNNINYILTRDIEFTKSDLLYNKYCAPSTIIQGELKHFTTLGGDESLVTLNDLDEHNRLYFPESMVAQNGVFITQEDIGTDSWDLINNLNTQVPLTRCYIFRYDSNRKLPYIQFPDDISNLIQGGLLIDYIITNGENGNVSAGSIDTLLTNSEASFESETVDLDSITNLENYFVTNSSALTNGADIEDIDNAYFNFQKTVGTFDTLVTCRDYANYIYNLTDEDFNSLVSNIQVCDRRDDFNYSTKVVTYNDFGQDTLVQTSGAVDPFDLMLYPLNPMTGTNKDAYKESFTVLGNTSLITRAIEYSKCLSHKYKTLNTDDIYTILNKYQLNAKITTTYKVNQLEQVAIRNNVIQALIDNFNARKVNYGQEIPYDTILKVIENADSRIKFVSLDEPVLKSKLLTYGGDEINWVPYTQTSATTHKIRYIGNNVLAGKISLYNYNEKFDYNFGQTSSNVKAGIENISTCAKITIPASASNAYSLQDNEVIQIFTPSFINGREWDYGWFYKTSANFSSSTDEQIIALDNNTWIKIYDSVESTIPTLLNTGYVKIKGIITNEEANPPKQINSGSSIIEQSLNKITLDSIYYLYWVTNNTDFNTDGVKCSFIPWSSDEYVLLDGEYLYVTDNKYSYLYAYGPGTKLKRYDNNQTLLNDLLPLLDVTEVNEKGINYLKDKFIQVPFNKITGAVGEKRLDLIEQQILTLISGDTIKSADTEHPSNTSNLFNTNDSIYSNILKALDIPVYYTAGSESGVINTTIANENVYIRARLDVNCDSDKTQTLLGNQHIYIPATPTIDLTTPQLINSEYAINIIGGDDRNIETYSFDTSDYITNSIYYYSPRPASVVNDISDLSEAFDNYYKLSVLNGQCRSQSSVNMLVPIDPDMISVSDYQDTLVMVYVNCLTPGQTNTSTGVVNTLTVNGGYNMNYPESGTPEPEITKLHEGINVLRFNHNSVNSFTITFNSGESTPAPFNGTIIISKPRVLVKDVTNSFNPDLQLGGTGSEGSDLLTYINGDENYRKNFYYSLIIDNDNYIDDKLMNASALFNTNNIVNKITLPEIDIDFAIEHITIAKSSQL